MLRLLLTVTALVCAYAAAPRENIDLSAKVTKVYDTEAKTLSDGYKSESYHVVTKDGYILEINRIPRGKGEDSNAKKPVVFMMHGLQGSAVSYFSIGPEFSMAYNLADAGFDVWIGNARGVLNSRNHLTLNPDEASDKLKFFDFTWEEIAVIDVPTMIDYVLEVTGEKKLHYIGHSQGGTVFMVLASMLPEYNDKFLSVHLLAGVGYQTNFPHTALSVAAISTDLIYAFARAAGAVEIFGPDMNEECEDDGSEACELNLVKEIMDDLIDVEVYAGASLKQFAHYGQNIRDKRFRRWNYGLFNFLNYGSFSPPEYNLKLITARVTMHYTVSDELLSEEDVLLMANDMPNTTVRKVARDSFTHTDFSVANDAKELVTEYIIEDLKKW